MRDDRIQACRSKLDLDQVNDKVGGTRWEWCMYTSVRKGMVEGLSEKVGCCAEPNAVRGDGCGGGEKMMEVGDDNNRERDVVSRSSICSSGGSNEIVHMYKSLKLWPPNIRTVLFRGDHIGWGTE